MRNQIVVACFAALALGVAGCSDSNGNQQDTVGDDAVVDAGTDIPVPIDAVVDDSVVDAGTDIPVPIDAVVDDSVVDADQDAVGDAAIVDADHDVVEPWPVDFEPGVELREGVRILRLKGSAYEMGQQHATFMHDELMDGVQFLETSQLGLLEIMAREFGFLEEAMTQSYPDAKAECQGMADEIGDEGWTMDRCMALAYGEIVLDYFEAGLLACSQFAVTGPAGANPDVLLHGRNLDWDNIEYLLKYPTIIVRAPEGQIPYVVVGFPGCVAAYNGMNAAGLSIATNENGSPNDLDRVGKPTVQGVNYMLSHFTTLDEVIEYVTTCDRMSAENMMVTSGREKRAVVFQMTANHIHYEELGPDGVVFITNHFTVDEMIPYEDVKDPGASTYARYMRLRQLLDPDFENPRDDKVYGQVDVPVAVSILRDRFDPINSTEYAVDTFDVSTGGAIAVNGAIYSIVFQPGEGMFWLASGEIPIPTNSYRGYHIDELLGNNPEAVAAPAVVE